MFVALSRLWWRPRVLTRRFATRSASCRRAPLEHCAMAAEEAKASGGDLTTLRVGMTCGGCANSVKRILGKIEGVLARHIARVAGSSCCLHPWPRRPLGSPCWCSVIDADTVAWQASLKLTLMSRRSSSR